MLLRNEYSERGVEAVAKVSRTSISVPAGLKARMDAVGEPVNWSAVACRAFEQTLAEITTRRGVMDMKDMLARLRASKLQHQDENSRIGLKSGQAWAIQSAEFAELQRLEDSLEGMDVEEWVEPGVLPCAYGPGELFVFTIRPDADGDRQQASEFWELILDDTRRAYDLGFMRGFITGALEAWNQVKEDL